MEPAIIYLLKVNIALAVLYGIYKLAFTKDTFFRLRRAALLAICIISLTYPFVEVPTLRSAAADAPLLSYAYNLFVPETTIEVGEQSAATTSLSWPNVLLFVYLAVAGLLLFRTFMEAGNLLAIRAKSTKRMTNGITVYINKEETEPFSFMKWIFIPPHAYTENQLDEILIHERTHAREWHSLDIILVQLIIIINWFNPFVWLLRSEIRMNHEYLADRNVVSSGFNKKTYQYHLMGLGSNHHMAAANLYNNFSVLPLKNRLKMLNRKVTPNIMIAKYLMFIPVFLCLLVFSNCTESNNQEKDKEYGVNGEELVVVGYGQEGVEPVEIPDVNVSATVPTDKPDVFPEYPGGEASMLQYLATNIKYPVKAQEQGLQGRVVARVVINEDGTIGITEVLEGVHELLDNEALRVLKLMPKWTPGQKDGKPVAVYYTIPIFFRLQ